MKIKNDEIIIKRREYIDLLMENAKLREQASPFHKYSVSEIRKIFGLSEFGFSNIELEENKIPEKINKIYNIRILDPDKPNTIKDYDMEQLIEMVQDIYDTQDEIIDYLNKENK